MNYVSLTIRVNTKLTFFLTIKSTSKVWQAVYLYTASSFLPCHFVKIFKISAWMFVLYFVYLILFIYAVYVLFFGSHPTKITYILFCNKLFVEIVVHWFIPFHLYSSNTNFAYFILNIKKRRVHFSGIFTWSIHCV